MPYSLKIQQSLLTLNPMPEDEEGLSVLLYTGPKIWYGDSSEFRQKPCPDCGRPLLLRAILCRKGKENRYGWRSCWCHGDMDKSDCVYEAYSSKSIDEWIGDLKINGNS